MKIPPLTRRFYRTRMAPTPSGYLHWGNAFSFALTAYVAQLTGADILLRIDDLDQARVRPEYVKDIFDSLAFMQIDWQEGPRDADEFSRRYSQTLRIPQYVNALEQLRASGDVFACTCSRSDLENDQGYPGTCRTKQIPLDTPGACWRMKTNPSELFRMNTYPDKIREAFLPPAMTDFVVRKKDGFPSYQLSSLVDDVYFEIDLVVRGEDLIDSTLAQLALARRLGLRAFGRTVFLFHRLIEKGEGKKLSKSDKDLSLASMIDQHLTRQDLYRRFAEVLGAGESAASFEQLAARFFCEMNSAG